MMWAFDVLLKHPLIRAVLRPEELQRAEEDEDWLPNAIGEEGESVLTVVSDSSMPGGCGAMWINEWRGLYFFDSSDVDSEGPFASIDEVLGLEHFSIVTSDNEIWSEVLPLEQLLQFASKRFSDDCGDAIRINGRTYEMTATGLALVDAAMDNCDPPSVNGDHDDDFSEMISRRNSPADYVINSADELRARVQGAIELKAAKIAEARSALENAQRSLLARQAVLIELERVIRVGTIARLATDQESSATAKVNELLRKVRTEAQADLTMAEEAIKACHTALVDWERRLPIDFLFYREKEIADAELKEQQTAKEMAEKERQTAHDLAVKRVCKTLVRNLMAEDETLNQMLEKCHLASFFCFLGLTGIVIIPLVLWMEGQLYEWRFPASLWGLVESALVLYWFGLRLAAHRHLLRLWKSIGILDSSGFVVYRVYGIFGGLGHYVSSLLKIDPFLPDPDQEHCYVQFAGRSPPKLSDYICVSYQPYQPMLLTAGGLELLVRPSSQEPKK